MFIITPFLVGCEINMRTICKRYLHICIAGYLFTVSILCIDPTPHKTSFLYRANVLIIALAGHSILTKYIFAHPPSGVSTAEAKIGGMLMYYGGDAIDLIIVYLLFQQWFNATRPKTTLTTISSLKSSTKCVNYS